MAGAGDPRAGAAPGAAPTLKGATPNPEWDHEDHPRRRPPGLAGLERHRRHRQRCRHPGMREREATYGYREADSSLTPAVEGLRELAAAGGDGAAALANAAGHLATAQHCRPVDDWVGDDDERRRGRMEAASAALAAARARLRGMEGSIVEAARAALGRAESDFTRYHYDADGFVRVTDVQDSAPAAAEITACVAFTLAAAELSAASGHLATAGGGSAASAAHAADLAAGLAASLAHAMSHCIGMGVYPPTPTPMRERL